MSTDTTTTPDESSDPGPGERSGISSDIAAELMDETLVRIEAEDPEADVSGPSSADDGDYPVGDDPDAPIHGSMAEEFEENLDTA